MLGWVANIVLITGSFFLGYKKRWAFLIIALGEFLWLFRSWQIWDMFVICFVFMCLALRNWLLWGEQLSPSSPHSYGEVRTKGEVKQGDIFWGFVAVEVKRVIREGKVVDLVTWSKNARP